MGRNNAELCFETTEIEDVFGKVKKESVKLIQVIVEQPWGQKVFRFYDPNNYIIEIAESMSSVVLRLHNSGKSLEEINKKSLMPIM